MKVIVTKKNDYGFNIGDILDVVIDIEYSPRIKYYRVNANNEYGYTFISSKYVKEIAL